MFIYTPFGFRVELALQEAWLERWAEVAPPPALAEVVLSHPEPRQAATSPAGLLGYDAAGGEVLSPAARLRFVTDPGRAGVLVGYRLTGLPPGPREDPCGALVWGTTG